MNQDDSIVQVLINRDGLSLEYAQQLVNDARHRVQDGEDPEELLYEEFGLEPDYIWDLLTF